MFVLEAGISVTVSEKISNLLKLKLIILLNNYHYISCFYFFNILLTIEKKLSLKVASVVLTKVYKL